MKFRNAKLIWKMKRIKWQKYLGGNCIIKIAAKSKGYKYVEEII